jgi:hypothetical protein
MQTITVNSKNIQCVRQIEKLLAGKTWHIQVKNHPARMQEVATCSAQSSRPHTIEVMTNAPRTFHWHYDGDIVTVNDDETTITVASEFAGCTYTKPQDSEMPASS